jgi:ribosomal protein S18 acetylase RimI-like enzyme
MIYVRATGELAEDDRQAVNELILRSFAESRLGDYETIAYCELWDRVIGAVGLYWVGKWLYLNQLCVEAKCRKQGAASWILDGVFAAYPRAAMALYVDKQGGDADWLVGFYSKRGFREVWPGDEMELPRDSEREYLMVRAPPVAV